MPQERVEERIGHHESFSCTHHTTGPGDAEWQ
jgi:hypothetical protein